MRELAAVAQCLSQHLAAAHASAAYQHRRCCIPLSVGALNRVIDRGTRGINWTLSSMVFNVVPTFFEVWGLLAVLPSACSFVGDNAALRRSVGSCQCSGARQSAFVLGVCLCRPPFPALGGDGVCHPDGQVWCQPGRPHLRHTGCLHGLHLFCHTGLSV
jgi:hypothetical protein